MTCNSVPTDHTVGLGIPPVDHARKSWSFIILHLGFLWLQKLSSLEIDRISIFLCYVPIFSRPSLPLLLCTFSNNRSNVNIHKIDAKQRHFLDKDCGVRVIFFSIWSVNNLIQGWLPRMNFYRQDFSELTLSKASWILARKLLGFDQSFSRLFTNWANNYVSQRLERLCNVLVPEVYSSIWGGVVNFLYKHISGNDNERASSSPMRGLPIFPQTVTSQVKESIGSEDQVWL